MSAFTSYKRRIITLILTIVYFLSVGHVALHSSVHSNHNHQLIEASSCNQHHCCDNCSLKRRENTKEGECNFVDEYISLSQKIKISAGVVCLAHFYAILKVASLLDCHEIDNFNIYKTNIPLITINEPLLRSLTPNSPPKTV